MRVSHPWDKLPDESDRAYTWFQRYLNLPKPRTLAQVSQGGTPAIPTIKKHSSKHRWLERAAAYDAFMANRELAARVSARQAAAADSELQAMRDNMERDAKVLRSLGGLHAAKYRRALEAIEDGKPIPAALNGALRVITAALTRATEIDAAAQGVEEIIRHIGSNAVIDDEG